MGETLLLVVYAFGSGALVSLVSRMIMGRRWKPSLILGSLISAGLVGYNTDHNNLALIAGTALIGLAGHTVYVITLARAVRRWTD